MSSLKQRPEAVSFDGNRRAADRRKTDRRYAATPCHTDDAIYDFLSALNSPVSLSVWLLYSNSEFQQLVDKDVNPMHYNDAKRFRDDYAASLFLAKADFLPLAVSKRDAAYAKFRAYEEKCRVTNHRLRNLSSDPQYSGQNVYMLNACIRKIEKILGDFDPVEWVDSCDWGPGSSTLLRGAHVSASNKFDADNGVTADLYSFISPWFAEAYPLWWKHLTDKSAVPFQLQSGNSIVTVPKNSKTDRVIAIEPAINLWCQKGIGTMIRRRLQRWGIDLQDQSINQRLSCLASTRFESGKDLTTIDFSSASDSIAYETVQALFSGTWLQLLNTTRSPLGTLDGNLLKWQKFSSMGNGYTFELESLIFYVAALSAKELVGCDGEVSVYGDDVILPTQAVVLFRQFCSFLGFTVNEDKSFSSSKFRESCGAHYFDGVDVKPVYLKSRLSNIQSVYKLANSIRLFAHRCNFNYSCDARFRHCFASFLRRVPASLRLRIPAGYGEGGFVSNFDEARPSRERFGIEGYRVAARVESGVHQTFEQYGQHLARLKRLSMPRRIFDVAGQPACADLSRVLERWEELPSDLLWSDGGYFLRSKTRSRLGVLHVRQWYNLGVWEHLKG